MAAPSRELRRFMEFGRKIVGVGRNFREHAVEHRIPKLNKGNPNGENSAKIAKNQPKNYQTVKSTALYRVTQQHVYASPLLSLGSLCVELRNPVPKTPLIFLKPPSSHLKQGGKIKIPPGCNQLHHEVEIGVVIGKTGVSISESNAMDHVGGYALALDMTARDIQDEAKKLGWPWTFAKGFDTALPVSEFIPKAEIPDPNNVHLWLEVDGEMKQDGNTQDFIFKIPQLISYISLNMTLEEGDLLLTGTPKGVSPVKPGQTIVCCLADKIEMTFPVTQ